MCTRCCGTRAVGSPAEIRARELGAEGADKLWSQAEEKTRRKQRILGLAPCSNTFSWNSSADRTAPNGFLSAQISKRRTPKEQTSAAGTPPPKPKSKSLRTPVWSKPTLAGLRSRKMMFLEWR